MNSFTNTSYCLPNVPLDSDPVYTSVFNLTESSDPAMKAGWQRHTEESSLYIFINVQLYTKISYKFMQEENISS